jgi:hypothetical protein
MAEDTELQMLKWISISSITGMTLETWLSYDSFWQEAIFKATQSFVKQREENSKGEMDSFMKNIAEQRAANNSATTAPINRPSFNMP